MDRTSSNTNPPIKKQKREDCDRFGDSYTQPATMESLKLSMKEVAEKGEAVDLTPSQMKDLDNILFNGPSPFAIFRGYLAYFLPPGNDAFEDECDMYATMFRFQGGTQATDISPKISHVISHRTSNLKDFPEVMELKENSKGLLHIVTYDWIEKSLDVKKVLPEAQFYYDKTN